MTFHFIKLLRIKSFHKLTICKYGYTNPKVFTKNRVLQTSYPSPLPRYFYSSSSQLTEKPPKDHEDKNNKNVKDTENKNNIKNTTTTITTNNNKNNNKNNINKNNYDIKEFGFETRSDIPKPNDEDHLHTKEIIVKVDTKGRKRMKTDFSEIYTDNIFVPISRAVEDYMLEISELEKLPKYRRRSPYPERDNISVFRRKDLEKRAIDKWGSLENLKLQKDFAKDRRDNNKNQKMFSFILSRKENKVLDRPYIFKPYQREMGVNDFTKLKSARVVIFAVLCNAVNCFAKLGAWLYTGSHSLFAEFVHSLADTINQIILGIGIRQSLKKPDKAHPYGWAKAKNISSLISGVGIFCLGSGLSVYHGVLGLFNPDVTMSLQWALATLGLSAILEGGTFIVALKELKRGSQASNMNIWDYITRSVDPTTNVVLLEDTAAVLGIIIAVTCISLTYITGHVIFDAIGSLLIGGLLGAVSSFIISTNTGALVGKSIPEEKRIALVRELESDRMIRTLIDVKATEAGGKTVKFKAEVDFDGQEVTRFYLESLDMEKLLKDMNSLKSTEEAEKFMLIHGENIVDTLGGAVDRIETNLMKKHPEIKHVDLEQL